MSGTFDATELKETGQELVQKISDEVNSSSRFIIGAVPDRLLLTTEQYQQLAGTDALFQAN